jgi:hypothetical protein
LLIGALASTHEGDADARIGAFATIVGLQLGYQLVGNIEGFYDPEKYTDTFEGTHVSESAFGRTVDDIYDQHQWFDGATVLLALANIFTDFSLPQGLWLLVTVFLGAVHLVGVLSNDLVSLPVVVSALIGSGMLTRAGKAIEGATNSIVPSAATVSEARTHQGIGVVLLIIAIVSDGDLKAVFLESRMWYALCSFVAFVLADRVGDGKVEARVLSIAGMVLGALNIYTTTVAVQGAMQTADNASVCAETLWMSVFNYLGDLSVMELLELIVSGFISAAIAMSAVDFVKDVAPDYVRGMASGHRSRGEGEGGERACEDGCDAAPKASSAKPCVIQTKSMVLP